MRDTTRTPWTGDQVENLRRRQAASWLHPYTRNGCSPSRPLRPTEDGWECDWCSYRQDWALTVDAAGDLPPDPFPWLSRTASEADSE